MTNFAKDLFALKSQRKERLMLNEERLNEIAQEYHQADMKDMYIENMGQFYELPWIHNQIPNGSNILDLGYGDGLVFDSLLDFADTHDCSVTMIEGSGKLVDQARTHAKGRANIEHSFFETYAPSQKFDVVLASHVLEHVDNPVELLNHLATICNKGAKIVGLVPNSESIHRRLAVLMDLQPNLDSLSPRDHMVGHQRVYSMDTLRKDFADSPWNIVESRGFFLKPLANSQLLAYDKSLIDALLRISDELPIELCANLAFSAELKG
jgi:2-polyprenyl-3-methyl-5-hydroxy-6-metoxy-1,4-benzoquinol methylase